MRPDIGGPLVRDLGDEPWIRTVRVGHLSPEEGAAAVRLASRATRPLTRPEAQALAERLGEDPLLIGLFRPLTVGVAPEELPALTDNVLERFTERSIEEARSLAGGPGPPVGAYREALLRLTAHMLCTRRLRPAWAEVLQWFKRSPEQAQALQRLVAGGALCRRTTEDDIFTFRHDRVRDAFLVNALVVLLRRPSMFWLLLDDPNYAQLVGRALTRFPVQQYLLRLVRWLQPLALVEAVRSFGGDTGDNQSRVTAQVAAWVREEVTAVSPGRVRCVLYGIVGSVAAFGAPDPGASPSCRAPRESAGPSFRHAVRTARGYLEPRPDRLPGGPGTHGPPTRRRAPSHRPATKRLRPERSPLLRELSALPPRGQRRALGFRRRAGPSAASRSASGGFEAAFDRSRTP